MAFPIYLSQCIKKYEYMGKQVNRAMATATRSHTHTHKQAYITLLHLVSSLTIFDACPDVEVGTIWNYRRSWSFGGWVKLWTRGSWVIQMRISQTPRDWDKRRAPLLTRSTRRMSTRLSWGQAGGTVLREYTVFRILEYSQWTHITKCII